MGLQPTPVGFVDAPDPQDMIDLESRFEELENEVKEINTNTETLKRNMLDLVELRHIIDKAQGFFAAVSSVLLAFICAALRLMSMCTR